MMHISAHQKLSGSNDLELTGIHILHTSGCYLTAPRTRLTAGWLSGRVRFHASITMEWSTVQHQRVLCVFLHKHYQRSFTGGGNGGDGCGCGGDSCGGGTVKCGVCFHTSHHPERDPSPLSPLKSNISPLPNTSQGAKLILGACAS